MRCSSCRTENEAGRKFCGDGVTLLEHGEATDDDSLTAEAGEIFGRLGAIPWLERARERQAEEEAEVTA